MADTNLIVGTPNTNQSDNTKIVGLAGKGGEMLVSEVHGKYYAQTLRGNTFWGSTAAAGLTLSIVTATSNVGLLLWNPAGSTKNCVLMAMTITPTTAMTTASGYGYGWLTYAGSGLGTAAPLSAFTAITATRGAGLLGASGQGGSVALLGGAATFTTAPLFMRGMGASGGTLAITGPATQPTIREDFDGSIIVPPGTVFIVGTTIASSGQTATQVSLTWEETPLFA